MWFEGLHLSNWRQFDEVSIRFHPRLTILTGANGSGKTTILKLLGYHLEHWNNRHFYRLPRRLEFIRQSQRKTPPLEATLEVIGTVIYGRQVSETGQLPESEIQFPDVDGAAVQYDVTFPTRAAIPGVFIPSHRPPFEYAPVDSVPPRVSAEEELYNAYVKDLVLRFRHQARVNSPSFRLKEALLSMVAFGFGNEFHLAGSFRQALFEGFQSRLRRLLEP